MAYVFCVKILMDTVDPDSVEQLLDQRLSGHVNDLDVSYFSSTNASLDDSIVSGTYERGDAFRNWLLCANIEGRSVYWSNQYGWTSYDLATRFDSTAIIPRGAKEKGGAFVLEMEAAN